MGRSIDETANGQEIELPVNDMLQICLPENAGSTGFQWREASAGAPVCAKVADSRQASADIPGRPGVHCWQFKAVQAGQGSIELRSVRPGNPETVGQAFTIQVRVR